MPRPHKTVHVVPPSQSSAQYQGVVRKYQATTGRIYIKKIERVENRHLYKTYMVREQKMDRAIGGNSERQLFHRTGAENITGFNTHGFNRSFFGANGESL